MPRLFPPLFLCLLLAGCNPNAEQERQARIEAQQRESEAVNQANKERGRREFWQSATWAATTLAVILLLSGIAPGLRGAAMPPESLEPWRRSLFCWSPRPVPEPQLDPELPRLPALERVAEILRFRILWLEHSLSPSGALREWLKLCARIGLLLGIPALFIVPALVLLFAGAAEIAASMAGICLNLLRAVLAVAAILIAVVLLHSAFGGRSR